MLTVVMMEVEVYRDFSQNISFGETAEFYSDTSTKMYQQQLTPGSDVAYSSTQSSPSSYHSSEFLQPTISKVIYLFLFIFVSLAN